MNLKRIIREELDSGLQWIKDVKSNKDIAEEYNMSVGTAHSRWSECRKLFYILLKGKNK